jgi:hypothetical protein
MPAEERNVTHSSIWMGLAVAVAALAGIEWTRPPTARPCRSNRRIVTEARAQRLKQPSIGQQNWVA